MFAKEAALGGMKEVEAGKIAQTQATSPEIVKFADMMIADHSKANQELKGLPTVQKQIEIPTKPDDKGQQSLKELAGQKKQDFDKAYIEDMIKDHKKNIELFKTEARDGKVNELKAFALKQLPILQHHLDMAEQTRKALK